MKVLDINGKIYKQYLNTKYYCNENGEIYSDFSHKILKPMKRGEANKEYYYIDINFGQGQKHTPIHKIVYQTWIGDIPTGQNVLHKDDNQFNNNFNNLYLGSIKRNVKDRIDNNHSVGNTWILTIYDKITKETITFCPAKNFIEYCGHPCENGNINRMFTRNWFQKRYEIISYYLCKSLKLKESVTTMGDECTSVEQNFVAARSAQLPNKEEEIV